MKILGIDSSSLVASVAIVEDDIMIAEYTTNFKKTHSQTLLPMIDEITKMTGVDIADVDYIAVSGGPGSFTGLRIGSATAKGLGLALDKALVHIPTLEAMAYTQFGSDKLVCPIMDARRSQVYTGVYAFEKKACDSSKEVRYELKELIPQSALAIEDLAKKLDELGKEVVFVGDGIPVFREWLQNNLNVPFSFGPAHNNRQRAGAVATLAFDYVREGKMETAAEHAPDYLRLSQAEREKNERQANGA